MEGQSGLSELSVISWVSAFEGCPLSGVPLYSGIGHACTSSRYQAVFSPSRPGYEAGNLYSYTVMATIIPSGIFKATWKNATSCLWDKTVKHWYMMRHHLAKCFGKKHLVHFPHETRTKRKRAVSVHEVACNMSSRKRLHRQAEHWMDNIHSWLCARYSFAVTWHSCTKVVPVISLYISKDVLDTKQIALN